MDTMSNDFRSLLGPSSHPVLNGGRYPRSDTRQTREPVRKTHWTILQDGLVKTI